MSAGQSGGEAWGAFYPEATAYRDLGISKSMVITGNSKEWMKPGV